DNAFADIYSAAVSTQNVRPDLPQRGLTVTVGAIGFVLALALSRDRYEFFLLLIGSVFVPLSGVFVADYFVLRRGSYGEEALFAPTGVRWRAVVPWAAGFALYQWSVPTGPQAWLDAVRTVFHGWLRLPFPLFDSALGASIPSFLVALLLSLVVLRDGVAPRRGATATTIG
ncbi:MAG: cytosine permease, partial [Actinomycetota bacterium]